MRIAVAMSGGTGSSLVAAILRLSGHDIIGITIKYQFPDHPDLIFNKESCPDDADIIQAKRVARQYNFRHKTILTEEEHTERLMDYIAGEYKRGRLPSAEIVNNSEVKFKRLLDFAAASGCEKIAAGYYARTGRTGQGRYFAAAPFDRDNDQSFYLCRLTQEMLQHVILPLGDYHSDAMKRLAGQVKLNSPAINLERKKTGIEEDALFSLKDSGRLAREAQKDILYNGLFASDILYMRETSLDGIDAIVKTGPIYSPAAARLREDERGIYAFFNEPAKPVIQGQAAVFYAKNGDMLGSGWIEQGIF